ncbi:DoxX family protein [Mucilaginibacter sabulilitoris]|uniref:DoxX family protein n=1 Tax=Mucilaginibacter sabulilitoris TaxID=1173583 RepID=A0ABZ0THR8_9SPHI|nr:DoxX family protein [Mucilaginibacter sabulilitoris]WPU92745.1 DoxX family protein [Mucilaginibacter sabulilitoris]
MSALKGSLPNDEWKGYEKWAFRIFAIYFFIQAVPLDWKYYRNLFSINWLHLRFSDIFYISRYTPQILANNSSTRWGLNTYADWLVILAIALIGTVIWSFRYKDTNYNKLYYWIRVIVRYRLAIGIIAYGFIKFFPLQSPYPSLSNLNTHYGEFSRWKLFSLSLGIVPNYEAFLGLVEILAGSLLLFRKTSTIGALMVVIFTGNVFMSNLAYEGGEAPYSLYLIVLGLFLLAFDAIRLFVLIGLERPVEPNGFKIVLSQKWQRNRLILKTLFIFFFVFLYGYKTWSAYHHEIYQFPQTVGLKNASGLYDVAEFKVNSTTLPYSVTDTNRWKNVVFEKWATLSIGTNKPLKIDSAVTEEINDRDADRSYEEAGSVGRRYYSYQIDEAKQQLILQNKNHNYPDDKLVLHYTRPDDSKLVLTGVEGRDTVYAVLNKIDKKYLLQEAAGGRNKAIKL